MGQKYIHLSEKLENNNIRPTHQRLKILEYFYQRQNHPTVDDIYTELKPEMPTITKATIYNNIKLFLQNQIVTDVHIDDNEVRYELLYKSHGHFKCTECNTIYDFAVEIDKIPAETLNEFRIDSKNVYFRGICPKCLSR